MKNDLETHPEKRAFSKSLLLVLTLLSAQLLPYCGGSTDDKQSTGGSGGSAGAGRGGTGGSAAGRGGSRVDASGGFGGHTSGCLGKCGNGCPVPCAGNGGMGGDTRDSGVDAAAGFAGHTAGCIGKCGGPCPPCPGIGGMSGEAGDATAVDAADAKRDAPAESAASRMSAQPMSIPACYALSGYEDDPCLPADDSLLPWLSNVPNGCAVRVEAGPFFANDGQGRSCCYFVGCDEHAAKAPNALP